MKKDFAEFSEFSWLFGNLKEFFDTIVPEFLREAERKFENIIEIIMDNEEWREGKIFGELARVELAEKLKTLDLLDYFPNIKAAFCAFQNPTIEAVSALNEALFLKHSLKFLLELMVETDQLKEVFQDFLKNHISLVEEILSHFGESSSVIIDFLK